MFFESFWEYFRCMRIDKSAVEEDSHPYDGITVVSPPEAVLVAFYGIHNQSSPQIWYTQEA